MSARTLALAWVAVAVIGGAQLLAVQAPPFDRLEFSCSVFPSTTTEADLRAKFGTTNVTTGPVPDPNGAEGDMAEGTILFANDPDALLEISWQDAAGKRRPVRIGRLASHGRWRTLSGIALGIDLKTIEKLNGRPFSLVGLASDVQGTVMSWRGGRIETRDSADCPLWVRLRTEKPFLDAATQAVARQVKGERIYSSGHPVMQTFNPTVYELSLVYSR